MTTPGGPSGSYTPRHLRDGRRGTRTRRLPATLVTVLFLCGSVVGGAGYLGEDSPNETRVAAVDYEVHGDSLEVSAVLAYEGDPVRARVWYLLSAPDDDRPWIDPTYRSTSEEVDLASGTVRVEWSEPLPPSGTYRVSVWVHADPSIDVRAAESYQHAASWMAGAPFTVDHEGLGRRLPPAEEIAIEALRCGRTGGSCDAVIRNRGTPWRRVLVDFGSMEVGRAGTITDSVATSLAPDSTTIIDQPVRPDSPRTDLTFVRVRDALTLVVLDEVMVVGVALS